MKSNNGHSYIALEIDAILVFLTLLHHHPSSLRRPCDAGFFVHKTHKRLKTKRQQRPPRNGRFAGAVVVRQEGQARVMAQVGLVPAEDEAGEVGGVETVGVTGDLVIVLVGDAETERPVLAAAEGHVDGAFVEDAVVVGPVLVGGGVGDVGDELAEVLDAEEVGDLEFVVVVEVHADGVLVVAVVVEYLVLVAETGAEADLGVIGLEEVVAVTDGAGPVAVVVVDFVVFDLESGVEGVAGAGELAFVVGAHEEFLFVLDAIFAAIASAGVEEEFVFGSLEGSLHAAAEVGLLGVSGLAGEVEVGLIGPLARRRGCGERGVDAAELPDGLDGVWRDGSGADGGLVGLEFDLAFELLVGQCDHDGGVSGHLSDLLARDDKIAGEFGGDADLASVDFGDFAFEDGAVGECQLVSHQSAGRERRQSHCVQFSFHVVSLCAWLWCG